MSIEKLYAEKFQGCSEECYIIKLPGKSKKTINYEGGKLIRRSCESSKNYDLVEETILVGMGAKNYFTIVRANGELQEGSKSALKMLKRAINLDRKVCEEFKKLPKHIKKMIELN
jgi:hypothetical protein